MEDVEIWTTERLLDAERSDTRLKFVFFWGHTPARHDGQIGTHVLSQWWNHPFQVGRVGYPTAEHFMMAEKARLFGDEQRLAEILAATSPGAAKAAGRRVVGFDEAVWCDNRVEIVTRGSVAKFSSSPDLRRFLLGTGDRVLVEASPRDRVWGIGLDEHHPDAPYPSRWRGLNLLGLALMRARAILRAEPT